MKKLFSLVLALCLLCVCAASFAETTVEKNVRLELDGFTLNLNDGEYYQLNEKIANQAYIVVFPFYGQDDTSTNYNFVWMGGVYELTLEETKATLADSEEGIKSGLEAQGINVSNFNMGEAYEAKLKDVDCVAIDFNMELSALGQSVTIYERQFLLGSLGYVITVTAASPEILDAASDQMAQSLEF